MAQLLGLPKGVSEQIEKMLELFPGQPADEKTMKQLWEHVQKSLLEMTGSLTPAQSIPLHAPPS